MKKQLKPKVDAAIQGLLGQLHAEEYAQLKTLIEEEGQRVKGIVWKEKGILLDGHTRMKICADLGIDFTYEVISLPDKQSAMDWVWKNQLGRRNLAKADRDFLIAVRVLELKKQKEERTEKQGEEESQSETSPPENVIEQAAAELKVSRATAARAASESNFCDRCNRTKMPVKGCKACAEKRANKPKKPKSLKKGESLVDWKGFESAFGVVVRFSDRIAKTHSAEKSSGDRKEYERAIARLTGIKDSWKKKYT